MANTKEHKVGEYVRLSKEDSRAGESVSIENQKLLLTKHIKEMGWELVDVYVDDGFSGTNQNRPALQRLLQDVKDKRINTVLIKDLSRLGRNYLEVGNFAEVFLPEHGCELISLNEKYDEMAVFRNWFNEQHSRSTSTKVKAVKRMCAQDGKYMGAYAPYGYKKSADNKHQLVPDEVTAPVVRRIFELRLSGLGYVAIARRLNEENITSPRDYFYQLQDASNPRREFHGWNSVSINGMLHNEVYIGNVVSSKYGSESYKSHRLISKPREEWIRVEAAHEPLVERDMWDRVQRLSEMHLKKRRRKDGSSSIFTGLMVCADCGMKMRCSTQKRTRKNGNLWVHTNFMCATYSKSGHVGCKPHIIAEDTLHELVVEQIREHAKMVQCDEARIVQSLIAQQTDETAASRKSFDAELKSCNKRLAMLDKLIEKLYEDRVTGAVPESVFKSLIQKYEQERIERQGAVKGLEKRIAGIRQNTDNASKWAKMIKQFTKLETLDAETLLMLIEKIIVSEPQIIDGERVCEVKIIYNHVGSVDWLAEAGETSDALKTEAEHGKAV